MRTLVLILTMHRSGSSATMRTLHALGMSLGPFELLQATAANRYGHFESVPLLDLDREVMHQVHGYADEELFDFPRTMKRLRLSEGTWHLDESHSERLDRARTLLAAMFDSGDVVGFKDPRVPLVWPFWRQLLKDLTDVRVLPLFVLRSPHEIAMSMFSRRRGDVSYFDALDACAIHLRRLESIYNELPGQKLLVRYDERHFLRDIGKACDAIGLKWSEAAAQSAFDREERHHSPAKVPHEAQAYFERLVGFQEGLNNGENERLLFSDAAAREAMLRSRVNEASRTPTVDTEESRSFTPFAKGAAESDPHTLPTLAQTPEAASDSPHAPRVPSVVRATEVVFNIHNIRLADGVFTKPEVGWTFDQNPWFVSARRFFSLAFAGRAPDMRVADVGCYEGGFTVEFARLGYEAVGIEISDSYIAACSYVKERLDLPNLSFVKDDAWNVGSHGPFDAIFCSGLFYHTDRPIEFLRTLANATRKMLILQTHFATEEPSPAYPGLSELCQHEGVQGRWFTEFRDEAEQNGRGRHFYSPWNNRQSFWVRREHLLQAIRDAGFDTVVEQFDGIGWPAHDIVGQLTEGWYKTNTRGTFIGIKSGIE